MKAYTDEKITLVTFKNYDNGIIACLEANEFTDSKDSRFDLLMSFKCFDFRSPLTDNIGDSPLLLLVELAESQSD